MRIIVRNVYKAQQVRGESSYSSFVSYMLHWFNDRQSMVQVTIVTNRCTNYLGTRQPSQYGTLGIQEFNTCQVITLIGKNTQSMMLLALLEHNMK